MRARNIPKIIGFGLFILAAAVLCFMIRAKARPQAGNSAIVDKEKLLPGFVGEKIIYDVILGKVNLGKATFTHLDKTQLDGKDLDLMTFHTQLARFDDLEKIYSDSATFLPFKIERNISYWLGKEKITENYDQENFILSITRFSWGRKGQSLIRKNGVIHNAVLLPYYVRRMPDLKIGWTFVARLPTQEFLIKLVSLEDVTVPAGTFKSYRFESAPKKFEIWVSADERRLPVKLKGTGIMGYTLVMRDYAI